MLTLYTTARSANGRKPLALCRLLGIEPHVVEVDVYRGAGRTPDFLAIHPLGKIPVLTDGELVLWESNAILVYLAELQGAEELWPSSPKGRAAIARWLFWEGSSWQPALATVLAPTVGALLFGQSPVPATDWQATTLDGPLRFLETRLAGAPFLESDRLSLADLAVAGMMTYARATGFPFAEHPGIHSWYERLEALEAWRSTAVPPWD